VWSTSQTNLLAGRHLFSGAAFGKLLYMYIHRQPDSLIPKLQNNTPLPHPVSLTACMTPRHSQCTLYNDCTQAMIPHLLTSDVYHHINLLAPPPLQAYTTKYESSLPSMHVQHPLATPKCPFHRLMHILLSRKGESVSKTPQQMLSPHMLSPFHIQ
jgi:hypothetical protein